jgi:single-strand DNA-binding protein
MFNIKGKLLKVGQTVTRSNDFKTREFVIETSDQYPQKVKFQVVKDKTSLLDHFKLGEVLEVFFNIRGNEWNEKYFVNLDAWKIDKIVENDTGYETNENLSYTPF